VSLANERGHVVLLTFLYTHCPDVCPLTAARLNATLAALGSQRTRVRVLAISVDPAGDTHVAVQRFVREHRLLPQFRYLTGPPTTLKTLCTRSAFRGRVLYDATATTTTIIHDTQLLLATHP
jgi:protein SCO1/2